MYVFSKNEATIDNKLRFNNIQYNEANTRKKALDGIDLHVTARKKISGQCVGRTNDNCVISMTLTHVTKLWMPLTCM